MAFILSDSASIDGCMYHRSARQQKCWQTDFQVYNYIRTANETHNSKGSWPFTLDLGAAILHHTAILIIITNLSYHIAIAAWLRSYSENIQGIHETCIHTHCMDSRSTYSYLATRSIARNSGRVKLRRTGLFTKDIGKESFWRV